MKKLLLILSLIVITLTVNAELTNRSGNVLNVKENGKHHALITIYENASDTAVILERFSVYIGNKLELAKDSAVWEQGKTLKQVETELLEFIIIKESKNGGILKYKPDLDVKLIEELK